MYFLHIFVHIFLFFKAYRCGGPRPLLRLKILIEGALVLCQRFVGEIPVSIQDSHRRSARFVSALRRRKSSFFTRHVIERGALPSKEGWSYLVFCHENSVLDMEGKKNGAVEPSSCSQYSRRRDRWIFF